jgi:hypothetical protein
MGGKTSKSTQTVSIPPEVLARYNAVNARAEDVASRPFQPYSYNPADFVAQLTPTQLAGIQNVNYAAGQAQPYFDEATGQLMGAQMAATPYFAQAEGDIGAGQYMGQTGTQAAQDLMYGGLGYAMPLNQQALAAYQQGYGQGQDLGQYAFQTLGRAGTTGEALSGQALGSLAGANYAAAPLQQLAQGIYGQAYAAAQPFNQAALQQYYGGLGAAGPLSQAAAANIGAAQAGAAPYQQFATELGLAAARPVSPGPLGGAQIAAYMSPYIQNVVAPTAALMNQQFQQAQASQLGNAIRSGAFGGDRAAIAAANLQQQQALAQSKALSDIMQSGYGQALAAAQQQQGIGLSAEQANRAAQQAAAAQLLGVGQTGFGQNISAAQQQAALAQQLFGQQVAAGQGIAGLGQQTFQQGLGAGQAQAALAQQLFGQGATTAQQQAAIAQALFGQGATQAQQQAALGQQAFQQGLGFGQAQQGLGQQLYAQGLGASQQQASLAQQNFAQQLAAAQARQNLGQGLYGMGAGTAQQLAALGTGAQGAALQGAQAQLAAGQAQQQTAQAGLQALYNQFLQQQAFPFQTAQFLANIATGTGALSGSTQTAVTPGGLFSDVRMKENIKPVGETFDGQPVYSYNYKGDDRTQMGLIAQEVERKHPEAVGLAGGMKTVDYDKATRDSVRKPVTLDGEYSASEGGPVSMAHAGEKYARGGYANGGSPGLANPNDMAALLAAQAQMFGPFSGAGMQTTGLPGMGGYVPQANLPVSELVTPGDMPAAPNAIDQMQKIADIGKTGQEIYQKYKDKQAAKSSVPAEKTTEVKPAAAYGGLIAKADGGPAGSAVMPYTANQTTALNIPSEKMETKKLDTPPIPQGRTVGDDVQAIAQIAAAVMSFSDSRVKEDIKHIGHTYDGQKIYSYRYKGEPQTHIGLLAQEVEKKHPEAVGDVGGIKTVDYDAATKDASDHAMKIARRAAGGMVPTSLGIPTESVGGKSLSVPDMPEAKNPLDELAQLASAASDISDASKKKQAAAKAYGGGLSRHGYALNGSVDNRTGATGSWEPESFLERVKREVGEIPGDIRKFAGYGITPKPSQPAPSVAAPPPAESKPAVVRPGLGGADNKPKISPTAVPSSAFANLPDSPEPGLAGGVNAPVVGAGPMAPTAPTGVAGQVEPGLAPMLGGTVQGRNMNPSEQIAKDPKAPIESRMTAFMDWVRQPQNFIPLATGIAAATAAPTRNTFVALAQGLGAGAQAMVPVQKQQAELERIRAETARERIGAAAEAIIVKDGVRYFLGADGRMYSASEWRQAGRPPLVGGAAAVAQAEQDAARLTGQPVGAPAAAAPAATPSAPAGVPGAAATPAAPAGTPAGKPTTFSMPDVDALKSAEFENNQMLDLPTEQRGLRAQENQRIISGAYANRDAAIPMGNIVNESARALMPLFESGPLTAGAGFDERTRFFNVVNTALRVMGFSPSEEIDAKLSDAQVSKKLENLLAGQRASALNQDAYAAFQTLQSTVANGTMTEDAVSRILADLYVGNQRSIDFANYLDAYGQSQPDSIVGQQALKNFQRQNSALYESDRKMLERLLKDKDPVTGEPIINYLMGVGQNAEMQKLRTPEQFEKRYPGILRYFYRQ